MNDNATPETSTPDRAEMAHLLPAIERMARAGRSDRRIRLSLRPFAVASRPSPLTRIRSGRARAE